MDNKNTRKKQLEELINNYKKLDLKNSSEETIRSWTNKMLDIFGWNSTDPSQILQEDTLKGKGEKEKLQEIDSTNSRPDYTFILGSNKITFLDAKKISVPLKTCKKSAFQIKSYGWSIGAPCAFITNFEEFVIYDTTYIPEKEQNTNLGSIYLSVDDYISKFDILDEHLFKDNILNGRLKEKYENGSIEGIEKVSLDKIFSKILSNFRLRLANNIYENNSYITEDNINYYIQVILNRLLFIRVCESKGLEKNELLLDFKKEGFWKSFKDSSYGNFFDRYDGPIFSKDNFKKDLVISDEVFDYLLDNLYYPSPYKFDVIPTHILSDIYELFLGKKLVIIDNKVIETDNFLYEKSNGVVITPKFIVESLTQKTLDEDYLDSLSLDELLNLKIIDISCGSGVFLIEAYIILENFFIKKFSKEKNDIYKKYFVIKGDKIYINQEGKRLLFSNCIFGVDINPESVEVTKMSLSLKIIDSLDLDLITYLETTKGSQILNGLGNNIKIGNSLVESDIVEKYEEILKEENKNELYNIRCFDWKSSDGFKDIFDTKGGFDFVIGNPPYVEAKNYNTGLSIMHKYLKTEFYSLKGKSDLLIAFIEKSISILNEKGKLGYVIQDRFFKTENGENIREIITNNNLLDHIISFKSNGIFKGKNTYISYLILSKDNNDKLFFKQINGEPLYLENNLISIINENNYEVIEKSLFTKSPWVFDDIKLLKLKNLLKNKFNLLGDSINKIGVGIQPLWNNAYHINVTKIENGIIYGTTKLTGKNEVEFELDSCVRIIENKENYSFKMTNYDKYCIFPYLLVDGKREGILWNDFKRKFPKTSSYLEKYKNEIIGKVQVFGENIKLTNDVLQSSHEKWHLFTRASNIEYNLRNKVAIPMTHIETTATFMDSGVYCDNSNVTFLDLGYENDKLLYSLAGIINSNLFSSMGKIIALKQNGGYYKFNKQCLENIPFPKDSFLNENNPIIEDIYKNVLNIIKYQDGFISGYEHFKKFLEKEWESLNNNVLDLYEITDTETRKIFLNNNDIKKRINLLKYGN
ncbi:MAG: Eco57I restriction-modification methylase domain-containing protein [Candidatus Gracilibacteria bacterium]